MTFALDLQKFAEKAGKQADAVVGATVALIAAELDFRSPVGDAKYWKNPPPKGYVGGRFRANWQLGIGSINRATTTATDRSPKNRTSGGVTTSRIIASIPELASGKVYYISNSLPYATALEHGHSRQAPAPGGVVGLTLIMAPQIVRKAMEQLP